MDHVDAKWALLRKLAEYRRQPYAVLRNRIGEDTQLEVMGRSGACCQVEIQILWDDKPAGDIRILASIDDGGWRACCPMTYGAFVSRPAEYEDLRMEQNCV